MNKITKEALLHIPKSNYSYGYDEERLHIRVRSKKGEVTKVVLRFGDPYDWKTGGAGGGNLSESGEDWSGAREIEMYKEAQSKLFDYWLAEIKPEYRRSRYAFIMQNEVDILLFGEKEILDLDKNSSEINNIENFFCFPYLNNIDIAKVPKWVENTVWYQIFPDRFANGDKSIDPEGVEPWGIVPTSDNFMGGDLKGILNKLDYLQDIGISGIYLCPITEGKTNHRYDTIDYKKIDKYLGDEKVLKELIEEAHKRDIKIMLDAVFNHIGYYSRQWLDVVENGEKSKYFNWFHIRDTEIATTPIDTKIHGDIGYEAFAFTRFMPKLNTENSEVIEYLLSVGRYWVENFNIDAWRLDVANEVDHSFWRKFRSEIKGINDNVFILGEIWHNSMPWLNGDQFDSVMNYPLGDAINKFLCEDKISAEEFKYRINDILISYPYQINKVLFNLIGSHDTTRVLSLAKGNKKRLKLAYLFMLTQSGSPCIYYGDEIGMDGIHEAGVELHRKCMVWETDKQDKDMLNFFKKIIKLRKNNEELRYPRNNWIKADEDNVIIIKKGEITILINNNDKVKSIETPNYIKEKSVLDLFTGNKIQLDKSVELLSYDYLMVKEN